MNGSGSRIARYKYSINKFIQTKSSLTTMSLYNKPSLDIIYKEFDHLVAICLISVMNHKWKKSKLKFHGYYIACGIDIAIALAKMTDRYYVYQDKIPHCKMVNFVAEMVSVMYQSLSCNVDSLKLNIPLKETLRINQYCINYLSKQISNLTVINDHVGTTRIKKTDFDGYKFKNETDRKKYRGLKHISDEELMKHAKLKYGTACKITLIFSWLFGLGDEKSVPELEELGEEMGLMFKIAYDFDNVTEDLQLCKDHTYNFVINKGIKESFELFMQSKASFIEGMLKFSIWGPTIKEILDIIEAKIDDGINSASIDEKYVYSEFSDTSSTTSIIAKNKIISKSLKISKQLDKKTKKN